MIEEQLEKLRREYSKISPATDFEENGLVNLYLNLNPQKAPNRMVVHIPGLIFAIFTLLILGGFLITAQTAKPDTLLYPLKLLSDNLIAKVSGRPEIKIEKRGQEVIDLARSSQDKLDDAANRYQKTLEETKQEAQKAGRQQEFKNTLEKQEKKFKDAASQDPSLSTRLENTIRQTEETKGQVKGVEDKSPSQNQNNPNQNNNNNRPPNSQDNKGQQNKSDSKGNPPR